MSKAATGQVPWEDKRKGRSQEQFGVTGGVGNRRSGEESRGDSLRH